MPPFVLLVEDHDDSREMLLDVLSEKVSPGDAELAGGSPAAWSAGLPTAASLHAAGRSPLFHPEKWVVRFRARPFLG